VAPACTLVLFARAPEPGRVKTRLSPLLGDEGSARLYRAFLEDAARGYLAEESWSPVLAASPDRDHPLLVEIFPPPWRRETQAAGGLGERLTSAFRREAMRGGLFTVAVGSDHPALPRRRLLELLEELRAGRDAAIIPAEDGGYCAIGLSSRIAPEGVFEQIPWSSSGVMAATLGRLREAGASVTILETFYDVDRPEDIARLADDLAGRDPAAEDFPRATAMALRQLRAEEALP
jgi:uncharacterized protein